MTDSFGSAASRQVVTDLLAAGHEAVFVGGAVRDAELGKEPFDVDITTSATPHEVKKVFRQTIDVGIEHGTVLVLMHGEPIEVTTYRTEATYSDRRRPDEVVYVTSLQEDLKRRDFTINALARTIDGTLVDLFNGLDDLQQGKIRSVGNPEERFQEDPLRIFRALRFSSVLDFEIDHDTLNAMKKLSPLLDHVAVERIKAEMDKLFTGKNPSRAFAYSRRIGLPEKFRGLFGAFRSLERYTPFVSATHGYASMVVAGDSKAVDFARLFKLSNEEKRFLQQCEELLDIRSARPFDDWDFYRYPLDVFEVAGKIHRTRSGEEALERKQICLRQQRLPILKRTDLAITGNDLLRWSGRRGGKWTSEWLEKIERTVVFGRIENDAQAIKDWFIDEISRET